MDVESPDPASLSSLPSPPIANPAVADAPAHQAVRRRFYPVALLILAITLFQVGTIRSGQDWGDDFAMYLLHARNIAAGQDYAATGYIYNPEYPSLGPRTYPPVFPLLLSPIYRATGQNLWAMKLEVILFLGATLALLYIALADTMSHAALLTLIGVVGLNPAIWEIKDSIGSDIPFLFFCFLSLMLISKWHGGNPRATSPGWRAVLAGAAIFLAYGTRSIGMVLVPALLLHDVIRTRRVTRFALIAVAVFLALATLQTELVHSDRSYLDQLRELTPRTIMVNAYAYALWGAELWHNGIADLPRKLLFLATAGLALAGFAKRTRDGITIFEIFSAGYLAAIILWPSVQGLRFILPLIPLYIFYLFHGMQLLIRSMPAAGRAWAWRAAIGVIGITYTARYATLGYGPIAEGIDKRESIEFFRYVRTQTPTDGVVIFSKPRALSLLAGRRAAANREPIDDRDLLAFIRRVNASYLVVGPPAAEDTRRDPLLAFVGRNSQILQLEYSNPDFQVFSIRSEARY